MKAILTGLNHRIRASTQCCAYAIDTEAGEKYDFSHYGLLYLDLAGAIEAMNAIHAHLIQYRRERSTQPTSIYIENDNLSHTIIKVMPGEKYHRLFTGGHCLIVHNRLNRLNRQYLLGGDEHTPAPHFKLSLQQKINVPFMPHWAPVLWREGIARKLLIRQKAAGVTCWDIKFYADKWSQLVTDLIQNGTISRS